MYARWSEKVSWTLKTNKTHLRYFKAAVMTIAPMTAEQNETTVWDEKCLSIRDIQVVNSFNLLISKTIHKKSFEVSMEIENYLLARFQDSNLLTYRHVPRANKSSSRSKPTHTNRM